MTRSHKVKATRQPQQASAGKETKAGNYFVSNYPPYSFWKPEHVGELQSALGRSPTCGTAGRGCAR